MPLLGKGKKDCYNEINRHYYPPQNTYQEGKAAMIAKRYEEITGLPCETHMVLRRHATDEFFIKSRVIYDHELVFVFGGNGVFTIEGKEYPATAGKLFYFYPGLVHQCETRGPDHVQFYAIHFSFRYNDSESKNCRLPFNSVNVLPETAGIKGLFAELLQTWKLPDVSHLWKCNILLEQLIFELLTVFRSNTIPDINHRRWEQATAFIEEHLHEPLNISLLCRHLGIKDAMLYRIFHEVCGESPMDYVTRRRMDEARELLYTENCSIARIGQMIGIDDPYYFSRLFRKRVGLSPKEFRSLFQKT